VCNVTMKVSRVSRLKEVCSNLSTKRGQYVTMKVSRVSRLKAISILGSSILNQACYNEGF